MGGATGQNLTLLVSYTVARFELEHSKFVHVTAEPSTNVAAVHTAREDNDDVPHCGKQLTSMQLELASEATIEGGQRFGSESKLEGGARLAPPPC